MAQIKPRVNVTSNSSIVTGIDTNFLLTVRVGDGFISTQSPIIYDVISIDSDTQITINPPYQGATASDVQAAIHRDYTPINNIPELSNGDIETGTIFTRAVRKIESALNQASDVGAITAAGVYPDTTAGIAGTSSGDYFFVPVSDEFILYLNSSGTAVEQLRFATLSTVLQYISQANDALIAAQEAVDIATDAAESAEEDALSAGDSAGTALVAASEASASAAQASTSEQNAAASEQEALLAATSAQEDAEIAEQAALAAMASANFKGRWSDLTGSLSVPAVVLHNGVYYTLLENVADVMANEPPSSVWFETFPDLLSEFGQIVHLGASTTYTLPTGVATGGKIRFTKACDATPTVQAGSGQQLRYCGDNVGPLEYDEQQELIVRFDGANWNIMEA